MLKTIWLAPIGMASLLIAPAADELGGIGLDDLMRKLEQTRRSLDLLEGIARLPLGETRIERVLAATEPPTGDPRQRDRRLDLLREEVSRLRETVDRIELDRPAAAPATPSSGERSEPQQDGRPDAADSPLDSNGTSSDQGSPASLPALAGPPPSTGLTPAELKRLSSWLPPVTSTPTGAAAAAESRRPLALEGPDYSADPLRQGRAYYRAGRYAEALVLLARAGDDPQARYWRARCHEQLGHIDEALAGYEDVARLAEGTALGERSRNDHDFLSWKQAFLRRLQPSSGTTPNALGEGRQQ